jgi:hypothetical protein
MEMAKVVVISLDAVEFDPELLVEDGISLVGSLHVLIGKADWDNEVDVEVVHNIDHQSQQHNQTRVLEVSKLDVHGPELHSPPDLGVVGGRRLEPERVPVGGLQVLEVHDVIVVINLLLHVFSLIGRHWIADEKSRHVFCHALVHPSLN